MTQDIMGQSTLPLIASHPDTSSNIQKSWIGEEFDTNTVLSVWLSISMADSLLCKDVAASTISTLMVQISANFIQLLTKSPQSID